MLEVGMVIAQRYEIVGKVGAGGMSDVYKARDNILGRFVAIKVLKPEFAEDRNFVTKFRTEAQSAAALEHPNIVNIYDVGSESGFHYIVMEYVEGITLKTYIEKKGQLAFKEAVSISIQVARGIEAAHNKHLIHRDIKPQNIMISTEGKVKVTDFGIARAASSNTISADVMGSVHYASPEQARNGFIDARSDIYSLGIVMYEMVTGRVPYDGDTTVAVALQHLQEDMTPPSTYAPDLPVGMEKIILKCTQKNPERRYQTVGELLNDLRRALITPDEDFVVIAPLVTDGKTRIVSDEELEQIREKRSISADAEDEDEQEEEDEEEDEDDEDGRIMNPKLEKAINILCAVVGVIIVIGIIFVVLNFTGVFHFGSRNKADADEDQQTESQVQLEMINIVGMSFEEANAQVEEMGLTLVIESKREERGAEDNTILEQTPTPGTMIYAGSTVSVVVAGEDTDSPRQILDVSGMTESLAKQTLTASGFTNITTTYQHDDTVSAGNVISQSPVAGTMASLDSEISLVISEGKESTEVPNVVGYDQETATNTLKAAGLGVSVTNEYSSSVSAGKVISQSVGAGKTVQEGTTVTIIVSLGEEESWYTCNTKVDINVSGATHVDVSLVDTDTGSVKWSQDKVALTSSQIANGYFTVTKSNMTTKNIEVQVTFYKASAETQTVETTDEDGNTVSTEEKTGNTTYEKLGSNTVSADMVKQDGKLAND